MSKNKASDDLEERKDNLRRRVDDVQPDSLFNNQISPHALAIDIDTTTIQERLLASQHRIKVNCDPPVYLPNTLLMHSDVIRVAYSMVQKEPPAYNSFGDAIFATIEPEDISVVDWIHIKNMLSPGYTYKQFQPHTIDNMLYVCNKYNISLANLGVGDSLKPVIIRKILHIRFTRMHSKQANPMYYDTVIDIYKALLKNQTSCRAVLLCMIHLPVQLYQDILKNLTITVT